MDNRYIAAAAAAIVLAILSYVAQFYIVLGYELSDDSAVWGQLGDYLGGLLNPALSFISIVLLIKSLRLQNAANESLREDLKNSARTEKLRSFESLFFNLLESQTQLFRTFEIVLKEDGKAVTLRGVEAALGVETHVEALRENGVNHEEIRAFIEALDSKDQIFSVTRSFFVAVQLISEKLTEEQGFCRKDREDHLLTLINLTDFAHLRLLAICMQFMNYHSVNYLRSSQEFIKIFRDVGLNIDLY